MSEQDYTNTPTPTKRGSRLKRLLRAILCVVVAFVLLNILLYGLLSIPFVQQKALDYAVGRLKEKVKTEIRIGEIHLKLFNRVSLNDIYIEDEKRDTLAYARTLEVGLNPFKLSNNELLINEINLDNFTLKVSRETPEGKFNFQFLIDAFTSTSTDTSESGKPSEPSTLKIDIEDVTLTGGKIAYDIWPSPAVTGQLDPSHIRLSDLNTHISLPSISLADLRVRLHTLSFKEQSGLMVNNLKGDVSSDLATIYLKDAELDMPASSLKIPLASYSLLTKAFTLEAEAPEVSPADVAPLLPGLKNLKEAASLKASVSGKLPAISVDSLSLVYGKQALLKATASISDYSKYDEADIRLNINMLQITPEAINDFARVGDDSFVLPDILKTLGTIRLKGSAKGRMDNLGVDAEAWANQGSILLAANASSDSSFTDLGIKANLQTQNFDLGSLLQMPELGALTGTIDLVLSQSRVQALQADAQGQIIALRYNSYDYNDIPFTAYYNAEKMGAWLKTDSPQGKLEAKVDMAQGDEPDIALDVNVQNLLLGALYPVEGWEHSLLSFRANGNFKGIDLKNIQSNIQVDDFVLSRDSLSFRPGNFSLKAGNSDSAENYIILNSSILKAGIKGEYDFLRLADELPALMSNYLPRIFAKPLRPKPGTNNFTIDASAQDAGELLKLLGIPAALPAPLTVKGLVNTMDNRVNLSLKMPQLSYNGMNIRSSAVSASTTDSVFNITGNSILAAESGDFYFGLNSFICSDTIYTVLSAKRDSTDMDMNIALKSKAYFDISPESGNLISSLQFDQVSESIGNLRLSFMPAKIVNENNRTTVSNFGFMAGRGRVMHRYFGVDGVISGQKQDTLNVSFYQANLGYILRAFEVDNVSAIANGDLKIAGVLNNPELYTNNMQLSDIIVFRDTLGTLDVKSRWSPEENAIRVGASLGRDGAAYKSRIGGLLYPKQDSVNVRMNLDRFSIAWLQPFMSDMFNRVSGSISSELFATGKMNSPDVRGWLAANDVYIGLDYTNVTYHIADTIEVNSDKIGFENLVVEDPNKNKAVLKADITHKEGFSDIRYTLNATLNNFMVLNTAARIDSLFYGKVYATGTATIKGSDDNIDIDMRLRNGRNSSLNVQIPAVTDADVYSSIVYINTPESDSDGKKHRYDEEESTLPLKLKVNLTVSPDIQFGVIINPLTGDNMQVKGSGLVDFTYDMKTEDMKAIGNYILSSGSVKLKLQNLLSMEFKVQEGSKLVFNGDPMRTTFDITAYKRVKADLRTLDANFGTDEYNSPKTYVDCVLGIKGNINKMELSYDISLPEASDDVQQRVKALIVTDDDKVKNFAYLVVAGTFYPRGSSTTGGNLGQSLLTNVATGAIGSVLNSALGSVIGSEWQVGANIESGDGTFNSMDMTVNLSRKFWNDKLEFNTNLGYRTDVTNENSFIGDFDVAYALTRSIKLKVFNKTNDRFYKQAPTTQGIGVVYTKEAKTLKELFRFFRKRRSRTGQGQTQGQSSNQNF
jgi:hypothetical protein